jgi:hypothetical protein
MYQPPSPSDLEPLRGLPDARSRLLTALGTTLGTYTFGTPSQSIPAIWVVTNPDTDPPKQYQRTGLECLIFPPEGWSTRLLGNAMMTEIWRFRLIQHDRSKTTLPAYYQLLETIDCYRTSLIPRDRDINEQLNLTLSQAFIVK